MARYSSRSLPIRTTIAILYRSPNGRRAHAAYDERNTSWLRRSRPHHKPLPAHELALVIDFLTAPHRFECPQIFIRALSSVGERHPKRRKFLSQPANAYAEHQPTVGEMIQRGGPLGQVEGIHLWQNVHPGAEPQAGSSGSDKR